MRGAIVADRLLRLLGGGAAYPGRMGRVAAHGDEEALGKIGRGPWRRLPVNEAPAFGAAAYKCGYKSRAARQPGETSYNIGAKGDRRGL